MHVTRSLVIDVGKKSPGAIENVPVADVYSLKPPTLCLSGKSGLFDGRRDGWSLDRSQTSSQQNWRITWFEQSRSY